MKELNSYISFAECAPDMNPFDWWRSHETKFPTLAILAKRVLSIPASSAPSERVFSKVNEVVDKRRNRMDPETSEKLVFLQKSIPVLESRVLEPSLTT